MLVDNLRIIKERITPAKALEFLKTSENNRRLKKHTISRYANEMLMGRWKEDTGETIKISKNGKLLDGQHRLNAVGKANVPVNFHICYGVDERNFSILDTGLNRNAIDTFTIAGISFKSIPSIISSYLTFKKGIKWYPHRDDKATNTILLEEYYKKPEEWKETSELTTNWYIMLEKRITQGTIGGLYTLFSEGNKDLAQKFFTELSTGVGDNLAVHEVRAKLRRNDRTLKKMPNSLKISLIVAAWNYYKNNKDTKHLNLTKPLNLNNIKAKRSKLK